MEVWVLQRGGQGDEQQQGRRRVRRQWWRQWRGRALRHVANRQRVAFAQPQHNTALRLYRPHAVFHEHGHCSWLVPTRPRQVFPRGVDGPRYPAPPPRLRGFAFAYTYTCAASRATCAPHDAMHERAPMSWPQRPVAAEEGGGAAQQESCQSFTTTV